MQANDFEKFMDKGLRNIEKQTAFATKLALTWTAKKGQQAGQKKLIQVVDSPIARTKNAFYIRAATKTNLRAQVYLKDYYAKGTAPSGYLTILTGGKRPAKRSEKAMRSRGLLNSSQSIIPTGIRTNKFGNVTGGMMNKILSGIKGQRDRYQDSKASPYFVVNSSMSHIPRSELSNGIYKRMARKVVQLFTIVDYTPRIRKRFDFDKLQAKVAKKELPRQMKKAMAFAMRTAR